jgi:hypothetical protein
MPLLCFSSCTQHASTRMKNTQTTTPLLCSVSLYHANSSPRSYMQLIIFFGGYAESVHHQWAYPEILCLLWQCDSSSSLSQLSFILSVVVTVFDAFHLSIVSMMSLHSTGSYLETLQLLWRSPSSSSSSLVDAISHFLQLQSVCLLAVTERTSARSCLWCLFPFLRNLHSGC